MRVLICGSRTFNDPNGLIEAFIIGLSNQSWWVNEEFHVIHGGARGADSHAGEAASHETLVTVDQFDADWSKHGKAAGPIRNQQMLDEGEPDMVIAFVNKPLAESRGTADMISRAKAAEVPAFVVEKVA